MVKSSLRAVLTYPVTWIAVIIPLFLAYLLVGWFDPPAVIKAALFAMGVAGAATWPLVMSATGVLHERRYRDVRSELRTAIEPAALEAELKDLGDTRPLQQLKMLQDKRRNLADILEKRLDSGEMTFARYIGTADRLFEATLEALHERAIALRSVDAMDLDYVRTRLQEIATNPDLGEERSTLQERLDLHDKQTAKASGLNTIIESALTTIDSTASALADAPMGGPAGDTESAMADLEELAERAAKYAAE